MHRIKHKRIAVIGAGVAGLSCAFYLNKAGFDVRVYEQDDYAGGMVKTSWRDDKYLIEHGPNTFLAKSEHIARLSRELSLDKLELHNHSKERFIYWNGSLRQVPMGPLSFVKSGLLTPFGKMRLMGEPMVRSKSPDGETLASFVRRRAGNEVLATLVNPFVSGVWAGDSEELEMRAVFPRLCEMERKYGSVFKGLAKEKGALGKSGMVSYRWGMGTLPARLEEVLRSKIKLATAIDDIVVDDERRLFLIAGEPRRRLEFDAVVVATGTQAAAALVRGIAPRMSSVLVNIPFVPLAVVHTAFKKADIRRKLKGFGMLVPRAAHVRVLGTIFSSALFEGRAPKDEELLTTFIGGATDPDAIGLSDEALMKEVRRGLHKTLGVTEKPTFTKITRIEDAIPQYTVGHTHKLHTVEEDLKAIPGLFLTGNYFSGISVSDTIGHARHTADAVKKHLMRPRITSKRAQ